ncbi:MAG: TolC family protein [Planctomycetes bacterium]|nr:TolC family protein [Planctomycetota bacterium]
MRRAERRLAAENARVGVATAAFYPSVSLTGQAGWQATDEGDLFRPSSRMWGISPSVYLPLFQGSRNEAALARAQARYEEVLEAYQQAVLTALAEVETALVGRRTLGEESAAQDRALAAARRARELSRARYDAGTVDYLTVLDAERTALEAERGSVRLLEARYSNTVALLRALGGRW